MLALLVVTTVVVGADAWYISRQVAAVPTLQRDMADRERASSLQFIRVQANLAATRAALDDMANPQAAFLLSSWSAQLDRLRLDLDDAIQRMPPSAAGARLAAALTPFWEAVTHTIEAGQAGDLAAARRAVGDQLLPVHARLVALAQDWIADERAANDTSSTTVAGIFDRVERQVVGLLAATLLIIVSTGAWVIRANRRLFVATSALSNQRSDLIRRVLAARESDLQHVSRELHDEFGQILTAVGLMIGRAARQLPESAPLANDLKELREVAQIR